MNLTYSQHCIQMFIACFWWNKFPLIPFSNFTLLHPRLFCVLLSLSVNLAKFNFLENSFRYYIGVSGLIWFPAVCKTFQKIKKYAMEKLIVAKIGEKIKLFKYL